MKVNTNGHMILVNGILISSTYFFALIWGGTKKEVMKVQGLVVDYFWSKS
jgi:hypothetical protein